MNVASKNDLREEIADLKRKLALATNNEKMAKNERNVLRDHNEKLISNAMDAGLSKPSITSGSNDHPAQHLLDCEAIDKLVGDFKSGNGWGARGFRSYVWSQIVKSRARYNCQICTSDKSLESHHMYGFKEHPKLKNDLSNGVCLCKKCHDGYHSTNGYENNTKEDFVKYLKGKKNGLDSEVKKIRDAYSRLSKNEDRIKLEEAGISSFLESL